MRLSWAVNGRQRRRRVTSKSLASRQPNGQLAATRIDAASPDHGIWAFFCAGVEEQSAMMRCRPVDWHLTLHPVGWGLALDPLTDHDRFPANRQVELIHLRAHMATCSRCWMT